MMGKAKESKAGSDKTGSDKAGSDNKVPVSTTTGSPHVETVGQTVTFFDTAANAGAGKDGGEKSPQHARVLPRVVPPHPSTPSVVLPDPLSPSFGTSRLRRVRGSVRSDRRDSIDQNEDGTLRDFLEKDRVELMGMIEKEGGKRRAAETGTSRSVSRGGRLVAIRSYVMDTVARAFDMGAFAADLTRSDRESHLTNVSVVGFERKPIEAKMVRTLTSRPQVAFRPQDLILSPDVAKDFSILDVKVGKKSLFASPGEIDGEAFGTGVVRRPFFVGDACPAFTELAITVRNRTKKTREFSAVISGPAASEA
jgi:hypothetical protein